MFVLSECVCIKFHDSVHGKIIAQKGGLSARRVLAGRKKLAAQSNSTFQHLVHSLTGYSTAGACPVMSVHFDERSGTVRCKTPWGEWYQTMEEVFIDVHVPVGTSAKEIKCSLGNKDIALSVKGTEMLKGKLYDSTVSDEGTWTLEDKKQVCIVLRKSNREAGNCWSSLLEGQYNADPLLQDEMQKKLTLERFQREITIYRITELLQHNLLTYR
ncbi:nudC domain-containing protein 2 isoform X2 [Heterodontus francisci]|uniref:nudC domain-containing protein 2 isoform X2 n=1 Tax=Heterodontus francisci TaxID=7792 RepID=UPI00355B77CC